MKTTHSRNFYTLFIGLSLFFASCGDDDTDAGINEPETYVFERDGASSVSFDGQTTRILMAEEILGALLDNTLNETTIDAMFAHQQGNDDFSSADLNDSDKSVRSKTAASQDYFSSNTVDASAIKADFDAWIAGQANDVFPNWDQEATPGTAGQIQQGGGGAVRYVNADGLEFNQAFGKSLIGALMVDQILNHYVSVSVLDAGGNIEDNDAEVLESGQNYTSMEHKWDEAYGYVYGTATNTANPNLTIGDDDSFLNKYIGRVEEDDDFTGIADEIFDAFKRGRAAIVAKNYTVRDEQAAIIREKIAEVIAIRAVYYLQQGKAGLEESTVDQAAVFHDLSEGFGFIYSLQFTRNPETNQPYFTKSEVEGMLEELMGDGTNGFWDVTTMTLDNISNTIAGEFDFTLEMAAN